MSDNEKPYVDQGSYKYHQDSKHVEHVDVDPKKPSVQGAMVTRPDRLFTPEEEARLYRKLDFHLLPMLGIRESLRRASPLPRAVALLRCFAGR